MRIDRYPNPMRIQMRIQQTLVWKGLKAQLTGTPTAQPHLQCAYTLESPNSTVKYYTSIYKIPSMPLLLYNPPMLV